VAWACATANVADNTFQWLIRQFEKRMIVLSDTGFHAAERDPSNLKLCERGAWQDRMLVETVLSMLTIVCHFKKVMHRVWTYFLARLAFTMAAFNILAQWTMEVDDGGVLNVEIRHSIPPISACFIVCSTVRRNHHLHFQNTTQAGISRRGPRHTGCLDGQWPWRRRPLVTRRRRTCSTSG
jgi:hypothetical protein